MSYVHAHVHTWYADTVYVRIGAIYIHSYIHVHAVIRVHGKG